MQLKKKTMPEKTNDIRLLIKEQLLKQEELFYFHHIEPLPSVPDGEVRYQGYRLNLRALTCTCEESSQKREAFGEGRDLRILCRHLYQKIRGYLPSGSLTKILAEHQNKFGSEFLIHRNVKGRDVYFGFSPASIPPEWISVYLTEDPTQGNFVRFSYSITERRWAYRIPPQDAIMIESYISLLFLRSKRFKNGFSIKI